MARGRQRRALDGLGKSRKSAFREGIRERSGFRDLQAKALKVLESPQRLPTPQLNGSDVLNLWQDAQHVEGILRRTTVNDYLTASPHWQTLLDYDALSKQDGQKWVAHGAACLYPGNTVCMMALSSGGEDAVTMREFNMQTGKFVGNGFVLPRSKQSVSWLDKDTLLVLRDWGAGTMTTSGYPFVVKIWKRGQPLEQAKEIYRASRTDEGATTAVLNDGDRNQLTYIKRNRNFFESEYSIWMGDHLSPLALPAKSDINGLLKGYIVATIDEDWAPTGMPDAKIHKGSVVALNLAETKRDPRHLRPGVIFSPSSTEFAEDVELTRSHLLLTTLQNVQGRAYRLAPAPDGTWSPVPVMRR